MLRLVDLLELLSAVYLELLAAAKWGANNMADLGSMDFSMKPTVDISGIAQVLQKKRIAEIEAKQAQRTQRMNELTQTVSLASNLASNMVEYSKEKQKKAFISSLGEALAATVPEKATPMVGPLGPTQQERPNVMTPDVAKQNLMRAATPVAPDKAGDYAFKLANPALGNDSLQFQRMTFKGTDGKTKTINVGVMGTQLVNPVTKSAFTGTPAEVDAMPEYGFVEREEYAGTDADNNPVFRNAVSKETYTKDAAGQPVPYRGAILPKLQNPSDGMSDKVMFIAETRSNLGEAIKAFEPDFTGPVAGRVASVKEWFNGLTNEKQVEFNQFIEEINLIKRNAMFGATLTEGEKKAFDTIALDRNVSPTAFMARLKALERKLGNKEKALMKSAKVSGKVFREEAPAAPQAIDLGDGFSMTVEED